MAAAGTMMAAGLVVATATPAAAANPTLKWSQVVGQIDESSPVVANLDGQNDVVVGSLDHKVYAVHGSDGSAVGGWPVTTTSPIKSSPSVADTDGGGKPEVFVGAGFDFKQNGGIYSYAANGGQRWRFQPTDKDNGHLSVFSTPAIGDTNRDGVADVTSFALGLQSWSLSQSGGANGGWPFYTDDTVFSSAALADVNGDGQTDIVIGGDVSPGPPVDGRGGILRAITGDGKLLWAHQFDEIVRSSPAIGDVDADGKPEIVVGTGDYWSNRCNPNPAAFADCQGHGASDQNKIFVLDLAGNVKWSKDLGAQTINSPALADINGDGRLDIAEGTFNGANSGKVFALDGIKGDNLPGFPVASGGGVVTGGITTADFNGDGGQDLLVPTGGGFYALDGKNGHRLFAIQEGQVSYHNSAVITDLDGNGQLDIIVAGFKPSTSQGLIERYEVPAADNGKLGDKGWPMFRFDARRTGNVSPPPLTQNLCGPPGSGGYWSVARDGGIFAYCDAKFFGSTGGTKLNKPIVAMTSTPSGNGYWLVASDGGIFAYGDAQFFGSTGAIALNRPIVGMASTPTGKGYWLVASDGGIFAFGDATFFGSMGGKPLNQPIVGMASTPTGNGYWFVAADGGIFSFGDATFFGSVGGTKLNQPVVGMTRTPSGKGYWFVATDGGIFAFGDAAFKGSTGAIKLNKPIVGMSRTPRGDGYWLVATDGGIFAFNAPFVGSAGSLSLNQPVVGMAAPGV